MFARSGYLGASNWGAIAILMSLRNWLTAPEAPSKLRRFAQFGYDKVILRPLPVGLVFLFTWPYSYLCRVANRATQMTVVAQAGPAR